jgi:UDP-galactopyranose mutase
MPKDKKFAIIGAGFSGAVIANKLALEGYEVHVFESRNHVAGNCHTIRDKSSGIMLHQYGPHIFHTDSEKVWNFISRYATFIPYINRVKTTIKNRVYSLPINLHTINQFYNKAYNPKDAKTFIESLATKFSNEPETFEEQALHFVGKELYEAFFESYTLKQWGVSPKELPASILKRLPLRFNYDDNYFSHKYQGMPKEGYTKIVEKLLQNSNIQVKLNYEFNKLNSEKFDHIFYTGPIDAWFNFEFGRLGYRTLDFVREDHDGDYQGCAVMNYGEIDVPYTRISEHKHFAPWEKFEKTVIFKEFSRSCEIGDIPYYPIRLVKEKELLQTYVNKANSEKNVSFLGRLGTYRYLDMDVTILEALNASEHTIECINKGNSIPAFFNNPL